MPQGSTQDFLEIDQIREGIIILKNKALRGIMMISSLNFALKSDEEQTAIIYQFQSFLNSLDFPCQIIVQSRKLNITAYLDKLEELEKNQTNGLLKTQTAEYRNFINSLVSGGTIMSKNFFIVIPFALGEAEPSNYKSSAKTASSGSKLTEEEFQRCKNQLWQRLEFIALGLRRCGLRAIPLNTLEIIEFIWAVHHPQEAEVGYYPDIPPELIM